MKKIKIKLFSGYYWMGKKQRSCDAVFQPIPNIVFIRERSPIVVDGVNGTLHCFQIVFHWLFLSLNVLFVSFISKDKEQNDNIDAGHPGTIIFHEEES